MARRAGKLREELAALDQEIGTAPPSGRQMHKAIPVAIAFGPVQFWRNDLVCLQPRYP